MQMWEAAVKVGADALLDGISSVRRCTLEGRAGMSLDLSGVEKGLRAMAPPSALSSLRMVGIHEDSLTMPCLQLLPVHLACNTMEPSCEMSSICWCLAVCGSIRVV